MLIGSNPFIEVYEDGERSALVASEEPFAEWFKDKLMALHGYDLRRQRMRPSPELIFEHRGDSGGP